MGSKKKLQSLPTGKVISINVELPSMEDEMTTSRTLEERLTA